MDHDLSASYVDILEGEVLLIVSTFEFFWGKEDSYARQVTFQPGRDV